MTQQSIGRFTGWHMTAILVAFFGVVIAVNLVMARFAVGTFGGTVVDNSYVASQNFNRWLAAAEQQSRLGWKTKLSVDPSRQLRVQADKAGMPISNLKISGVASHPLGRAPSIPLSFAASPNGGHRSQQALPKGRWKIALALKSGPDTVNLVEPVQ
jgi:nitrogen fixation protein FixH